MLFAFGCRGASRRSLSMVLSHCASYQVAADPVAVANPGGEIYAKVIGAVAGASGQTRIRFTSLSPELKAWVQPTAARLGSTQAPPA